MRAENVVKIGLVFFVVFLAGTLYGVWYMFKHLDTGPLAEKYEEMLSNYVVPHVLDSWEPVETPEALTGLDSITGRLLSAIPTPSYAYHFHLVNDPQVNALTLPGGHIVVFSGLICNADGPEQVAAVIAHELGHAENRHVITRTLAETGITLSLAILLGQDARMGYELSRHLISSFFSREQETEADAWGLRLMSRSGIHPKSHALFFRKMQAMQQGSELPVWLSSHPDHQSRIDAAEAYLPGIDFNEIPMDSLSWNSMRKDLCKP